MSGGGFEISDSDSDSEAWDAGGEGHLKPGLTGLLTLSGKVCKPDFIILFSLQI